MELVARLRDLSGREGPLFEAVRDALRPSLRESPEAAFGILLMPSPSADGLKAARALSAEARTILVTGPEMRLSPDAKWSLLAAGVCDILDWLGTERIAEEITSRITRWREIEDIITNDRACATVVGCSPTWQRILRQIVEIAIFSDTDLLLTGETGTGKEQVARLVHHLDRRARKGDLVCVDCTTLSRELMGSELFGHERGSFTGAVASRDGAVALARRGTLFLDEIGELDLPLQAQFLRVIQERSFKRVGSGVWQQADFRLICATNRDLKRDVQDGEFRADLYYRISGRTVRLPPLRERREDIPFLATCFLEQASGRHNKKLGGFHPSAIELLGQTQWPGNVRELQNEIERAVALASEGETLTAAHFSPSLAASPEPTAKSDCVSAAAPQSGECGPAEKSLGRAKISLQDAREAYEARYISQILAEHGGNVSHAAVALRLSRVALQKKMKRYGLR